MEIVSVKPKPYENSVFPGISFEVEISYEGNKQAIIGITGWIQTDDGKIIAEVREERSNLRVFFLAASYVGEKDKDYFKTMKYKTTLVALLDKTALDYLEKRRIKHEMGRVKLGLILNVKTIESYAILSHLHLIEPQEIGLRAIGRKKLVAYEYDRKYYPPRIANFWIISGSDSPIFLCVREWVLTKSIEIPSDEWIHIFAPKLNLGEYFVIEIPKGEEIIKEAWEYVKKAEEGYRNWDFKSAYSNCREVGKLLDRLIKEKFGKDSFTYKERWARAYSRFENLASLALHIEDLKAKKGVSPEEVKVGRADVEHLLIVTKALIKYAEELLKGF